MKKLILLTAAVALCSGFSAYADSLVLQANVGDPYPAYVGTPVPYAYDTRWPRAGARDHRWHNHDWSYWNRDRGREHAAVERHEDRRR